MSALPDEKDTLKESEKPAELEVVIEGEETPVEVAVVDDTPPEDRNRKPLPEGEAEPTDEEMEHYSDAVKKRIAKMKHGIHDERRAKEAAARERDEAVALARRVMEEKKALEARYTQGEDALITQTKERADLSMADAKRMFKQAYELGDADAMAEAQEKISAIAMEKKQADVWAQQATQRKQESARQAETPVVQSAQSSQNPIPEPDSDAKDWATKNKWFGQHKIMTATAYGVHDELIEQGLDPKTDSAEYYQKLNAKMREVFPTYEWSDTPKKKPITTVVAPVNRTSKTATRVTLTRSQVAVANRLGLTPLQYATALAKLQEN